MLPVGCTTLEQSNSLSSKKEGSRSLGAAAGCSATLMFETTARSSFRGANNTFKAIDEEAETVETLVAFWTKGSGIKKSTRCRRPSVVGSSFAFLSFSSSFFGWMLLLAAALLLLLEEEKTTSCWVCLLTTGFVLVGAVVVVDDEWGWCNGCNSQVHSPPTKARHHYFISPLTTTKAKRASLWYQQQWLSRENLRALLMSNTKARCFSEGETVACQTLFLPWVVVSENTDGWTCCCCWWCWWCWCCCCWCCCISFCCPLGSWCFVSHCGVF